MDHPTSRTGAAACALWLIVAACGAGHDAGGADQGPVVAVFRTSPRIVAFERHWTGRLEPLRTLAVQAPREGRVSAVAVRDGDLVDAGDVLVRLEGPDLQARSSALTEREQLLAAEADRWQQLAESGAAGPAEVAQARLRLLEIQELASEVQATVESYSVLSPVAGRVYGASIGVGNNVNQGQILLHVDDGDAYGVRLVVSATETGYFDDPSLLEVRDDRGTLLEVDRIAFTSDAHPALVRADVYVRGGDIGRRAVTVTYSTSQEVLLVPWMAVANDGDRHWVAVVSGEPGQVERRIVELGRAYADGIEVRAGLSDEDLVIRHEPRAHADGRVVRPIERPVGAGL